MTSSDAVTVRVWRQFTAFAIVGAIGTVGHYSTLVTLVELFRANPVFATTVGFTVGAVINYFLNYRLTFRSDKPHREAMTKFLIVALLGAGLNSLLMHAGLQAGMYYLVAQLIATGVVLGFNFLLSRLWTFA